MKRKMLPFEGVLNCEFQGLVTFVAPLSFAVRVMEAVIFVRSYGTFHLVGHHCSMAVLEGPHALRVKKGDTVAVVQDMP